MTHPLLAKRDELIKQLRDIPGFVSVGLAKRNHDIVLLVAVDGLDASVWNAIPGVFEGVGVVVEDLGEAQVQLIK